MGGGKKRVARTKRPPHWLSKEDPLHQLLLFFAHREYNFLPSFYNASRNAIIINKKKHLEIFSFQFQTFFFYSSPILRRRAREDGNLISRPRLLR